VVGKPRLQGAEVRANISAATALRSASLHYTTDLGLRSKRKWVSVPARLEGGQIVAPKPPAEANTWYLSVTDERQAMVSSEVMLDGR
jgi:hypothetical protein